MQIWEHLLLEVSSKYPQSLCSISAYGVYSSRKAAARHFFKILGIALPHAYEYWKDKPWLENRPMKELADPGCFMGWLMVMCVRWAKWTPKGINCTVNAITFISAQSLALSKLRISASPGGPHYCFIICPGNITHPFGTSSQSGFFSWSIPASVPSLSFCQIGLPFFFLMFVSPPSILCRLLDC